MKKEINKSKEIIYYIKVKEILNGESHQYFDGLEILKENDGSVIWGPVVDQSALHSILAKIRDLNLTIVSIKSDSQNKR